MVTIGDGSNGYPTKPLVQYKNRKWVSLSDEEKFLLAEKAGCMSSDWIDFANLIEQTLKDKNP